MTQITLHIDGMMCGMCEAHVNDAVRKAISAKKVKSSHSAGTCVILTEQEVDTDALKAAIDATGYTVTGVDVAPYDEKGPVSPSLIFR